MCESLRKWSPVSPSIRALLSGSRLDEVIVVQIHYSEYHTAKECHIHGNENAVAMLQYSRNPAFSGAIFHLADLSKYVSVKEACFPALRMKGNSGAMTNLIHTVFYRAVRKLDVLARSHKRCRVLHS
jgi:hypothetical protein